MIDVVDKERYGRLWDFSNFSQFFFVFSLVKNGSVIVDDSFREIVNILTDKNSSCCSYVDISWYAALL